MIYVLTQSIRLGRASRERRTEPAAFWGTFGTTKARDYRAPGKRSARLRPRGAAVTARERTRPPLLEPDAELTSEIEADPSHHILQSICVGRDAPRSSSVPESIRPKRGPGYFQELALVVHADQISASKR